MIASKTSASQTLINLYPFYPDGTDQQAVYDKLSALPDYITVVAAVSFREDKSIAQVLEFRDSLLDGSVGWTAIRHGSTEEQMLPLCGKWGSVREDANEAYPCLDILSVENTPENLETHFRSLLRFCADQEARGTGISTGRRNYYTDVLDYVEKTAFTPTAAMSLAPPKHSWP